LGDNQHWKYLKKTVSTHKMYYGDGDNRLVMNHHLIPHNMDKEE
jgi:hypothetical protein